MTLSDEQIERYSRQIIVRGVGGRGQERLLHGAVLVAGGNRAARTATLYLAGAGIGRIDVASPEAAWGAALASELLDLNPDVRAGSVTIGEGGAPLEVYDAVVAMAPEIEAIRLAVRSPTRCLITAGSARRSGWLTVSARSGVGAPCPLCAARALGEDAADDESSPGLTTEGVIGSLAALEVLRLLLDIGNDSRGKSLHYDAETATLNERAPSSRSDCELCDGAD